jgi:hypothetical protein
LATTDAHPSNSLAVAAAPPLFDRVELPDGEAGG